MGIIGRLLGQARRGTAASGRTAPTAGTGRRGIVGTGRSGGLLSSLLRRKGL